MRSDGRESLNGRFKMSSSVRTGVDGTRLLIAGTFGTHSFVESGDSTLLDNVGKNLSVSMRGGSN